MLGGITDVSASHARVPILRRLRPTGGRVTIASMVELPRGTISLVFTDIEGSTQLAHLLGERYRVSISGRVGCCMAWRDSSKHQPELRVAVPLRVTGLRGPKVVRREQTQHDDPLT